MDALSIYWNAVWRDGQPSRAIPAPEYSAADLAAFSRRRALALTPSFTAVTGKWSAPRFRVVR